MTLCAPPLTSNLHSHLLPPLKNDTKPYNSIVWKITVIVKPIVFDVCY